MKNFVLGCALAIAGVVGSVEAGNYYYDDCCCPENKFDGFYIGVNSGVISHVARRNDLDGFLTDNSSWSTLDTGYTGGGQIGWDWQCDSKVFGVVADFNGNTLSTTLIEDPNGVTPGTLRSQMNWHSTIRARAGLQYCNSLVYVTLGAAVGHFQTRWAEDADEFNFNRTRWGWTGGVGTEFFVCGNFTVGADVFFIHFADRDVSAVDGADTTFAFRHNDSLWGGRILLNYRFGDLFSCFCR